MGERDIDKLFHNKLKGYSKDVDTDALLSSLELPEKKSRRPFIFLILGILLVVFLSMMYTYSTKNHKPQKEEIASLDKYATRKESMGNISNPTIVIAKAPRPKSITVISSDQIVSSHMVVNNTKYEVKDRTLNDQTILIKRQAQQKTDIYFRPQTNLHKKEMSKTSIKNSRPSVTLQENYSTETAPSDIVSNHIQPNPSLKPSSHIALLTLDPLVVNPQFLLLPEIEPLGLDIKYDKHLHRKTSRRLSFSIYSGIYGLDRTLAPLRSAAEPFLAQKEASEKPLELISAGAQIKYNFGSIYIKTGLEFQSLNERFEYEQFAITDTTSSQGTVGLMVDAYGNSTEIIGAVLQENTRTSTWRHHNNYRQITIPFILGYEINKNKWYFSAEAQALLYIDRRFSGIHLDSSITVVTDVDSAADSAYNLGYGLSVGMGYRINKSVSINLRPHYFWYSNTIISEEDIRYSQRYNAYGIQLGLSYQLF